MAFSERSKGKITAFMGTTAVFALALPGVFALASTVAVRDSLEPKDGTKLISVEEVPFRTIVVDDDSLPSDVEVEQQPGVSGFKHVFATAAYDEIDILTIRERMILPPQDRVILHGTHLDLPKVEAAKSVAPVKTASQVASRSNQNVDAPVGAPAGSEGLFSAGDMMFRGVINWGGYKFTYYSQSVLPGSGLRIPGRHVNDGGFVSDSDGYIVLAAAPSIPHGSVFETPFGASGKVYDTCGSCTPNWLDVYTR